MKNEAKYDNIIMSWSSFGDFVLISQSMKTLIENGFVKKGVIITHQKEFKNLLAAEEKVDVLYPTQNIKDFLKLLSMSFSRNIFVLHDMPSHNRFTKEIRLAISVLLTKIRISSKLILLLDKDFKEDVTTKISKVFSNYKTIFDKTKKVHISQYILDIISEAKITEKLICEYNIKFNEKEFDISSFGEKYIAMNPFASSDDKSMSVDWYIEYINKLRNITNKKIILIGGEKDEEKSEKIKKETLNVINLCGETSFREMLYILKNCESMINVDSGPTHYGTFYKKPQIILWGENNNFTYMPTHNPKATFVFGNKIVDVKDIYKADIKFTKYADVDTTILAYKNLGL